MKKIKAFSFLIFILVCSCKSNEQKLEEIISSDLYEIRFIEYHGGIAGVLKSDDETSLKIDKQKDSITLDYQKINYSKQNKISIDKIVDLEDWLYNAVLSHNDNKEYIGGCSSYYLDIEIRNNNQSVYIRPDEITEHTISPILQDFKLID